MEIRATARPSSATVSGTAPSLQTLAIVVFVSTIVGTFVVVGFGAVTLGALTGASGNPRVRRRDRTGPGRIADVRGDDHGGALYR